MPAPKNNQNAAKPASEQATAKLHLRVHPADKSRWVQAAARRAAHDPDVRPGLAAWVVDALNAEAAAEDMRALGDHLKSLPPLR